jgi:hypothetical protein
MPTHTLPAQIEEQGNLPAEPEEIEIITSSTTDTATATPAEPPAVEGPGCSMATAEDNNSSEQY